MGQTGDTATVGQIAVNNRLHLWRERIFLSKLDRHMFTFIKRRIGFLGAREMPILCLARSSKYLTLRTTFKVLTSLTKELNFLHIWLIMDVSADIVLRDSLTTFSSGSCGTWGVVQTGKSFCHRNSGPLSQQDFDKLVWSLGSRS